MTYLSSIAEEIPAGRSGRGQPECHEEQRQKNRSDRIRYSTAKDHDRAVGCPYRAVQAVQRQSVVQEMVGQCDFWSDLSAEGWIILNMGKSN